ncbi:MAG: hypothetical protein J1E63_02225 [Muribaculaceae bacterium]|nr:hypothetical protein [Muribaculaceae bacterium]
MKHLKFVLVLLTLLISCLDSEVMAQNFYAKQKSNLKDRKEYNKERDSFNKTRVSKENKKLAKEMEKQGWKVNGGNPDLSYQLQVKDDYTTFRDEENNLIYICGSYQGKGNTLLKASLVAEQMAQRQLLQQIQTKFASLGRGSLINDDLDLDIATKTFVAGIIKRAHVIYNVYIKEPDGTYTVDQTWAVDARTLDKEIQDELNKQKKEELKEMHQELDDAIDF